MIGAATILELLAPTEAAEVELAQVTGQQGQELDQTEMQHFSLSLSIYRKVRAGTTSSLANTIKDWTRACRACSKRIK